jgi:gas vesicle protein
MQSGAVALQQQLADAIKHQSSLVEEKVRAFSEQQYTELENFRKNAHDDQQALLK